MTTIRLHNTKTRKKEVFEPLDPENVRMYVCGPTVYDRAHLGNARPVVVFDVLYRLFRHVYGADHVTYVRNFTDVDDKINARAGQIAAEMTAAGDGRPLEEIVRALTDETIGWYHADMDALGALRPDKEPRATEWIGAMIGMIETLIARGHAYEAEGHVLFSVASYADYGRLSGRSVEDMIAGARVEVAPYKRDPMDFVLWKPSETGVPGWDSPWGRGRPGWHIECSAMARELLGESFDIHGGGIDLQFPHHENEIAQSCCAHPEGDFARVWLHNEMLLVEGKKMSKSLGNFFTVRDLLEKGVPGEVIRFVLLSTHYRSPMDWTERKRRDAQEEIDYWLRKLSADSEILAEPVPSAEAEPGILEALADDLNTSLALARLIALGRSIDNSKQFLSVDDEGQLSALRRFVASAELMGFSIKAMLENWKQRQEPVPVVDRILMQIVYARSMKDWNRADELRDQLVRAGVRVKIGKDAIEHELTPDFDPAKLEALE